MIPIRYVVGDATLPAGELPLAIAHVVNDKGKWGKGFTAPLTVRYPAARDYYRECHRLGLLVPGTVHVRRDVAPRIHVAHLVAQRGLPSRQNPAPLDLVALQSSLSGLAEWAKRELAAVHMPRIGAGLARGKWREIEPLIQQHLSDRDIPVTVYDLPS